MRLCSLRHKDNDVPFAPKRQRPLRMAMRNATLQTRGKMASMKKQLRR